MKFIEADLALIKFIITNPPTRSGQSSSRISRFLKEKSFSIGKGRGEQVVSATLGEEFVSIFAELNSPTVTRGTLGDANTRRWRIEGAENQIKTIYKSILYLLQRDQALAEFISRAKNPNLIFYGIFELLNENSDFLTPETSHNLKKLIDHFSGAGNEIGANILAEFEIQKAQLFSGRKVATASKSGSGELPDVDIISCMTETYNALPCGNLVLPTERTLMQDLSTIAEFEGKILEEPHTKVLAMFGLPVSPETAEKRNILYFKIHHPENLFTCFDAEGRSRIITFNQILNQIFYKSYIAQNFLGEAVDYDAMVEDVFSSYKFHPSKEEYLRRELTSKYKLIFNDCLEKGCKFGLEYLIDNEDLEKFLSQFLDEGNKDTLGFTLFDKELYNNSSISIRINNNFLIITHNVGPAKPLHEELFQIKFPGIAFRKTSYQEFLDATSPEVAATDRDPQVIAFYVTDPFQAHAGLNQLSEYFQQKNQQRLENLWIATDRLLDKIAVTLNGLFDLKGKERIVFRKMKDYKATLQHPIQITIEIPEQYLALATKLSKANFTAENFFSHLEGNSFVINVSNSENLERDAAILEIFFAKNLRKTQEIRIKEAAELERERAIYEARTIDDILRDVEPAASRAPKKKKPKKKNTKPTASVDEPTTPAAKIGDKPKVTTTEDRPIEPLTTSVPSEDSKDETVAVAAAVFPQEPPQLTIDSFIDKTRNWLKQKSKPLKEALGEGIETPILTLRDRFLIISFPNSENPRLTIAGLPDGSITTSFTEPDIFEVQLLLPAELSELREFHGDLRNFMTQAIFPKEKLAAASAVTYKIEDTPNKSASATMGGDGGGGGAGYFSIEDDEGLEELATPSHPALSGEMTTLLRKRQSLPKSIKTAEAAESIVGLILENKTLENLLTTISTTAEVKLQGSILHNKFPQDLDVSVIVPEIKTNTEIGINTFFGVTLPTRHFALPTKEQKAAIFSKISIPEELQDYCKICIQGGFANSFLRIKMGDVDITCTNDSRTIGWTTSDNGMMLDWRSRNLEPKHGFDSKSPIQVNQLAHQTYFHKAYSLYPDYLSSKPLIASLVTNLSTSTIREYSIDKFAKLIADKELFIARHDMSPERKIHFEYNFAVILKAIPAEQLRQFDHAHPERIAEEIEKIFQKAKASKEILNSTKSMVTVKSAASLATRSSSEIVIVSRK